MAITRFDDGDIIKKVVDEIVMTLTNNVKFYADAVAGMKELATRYFDHGEWSETDYKKFRRTVFDWSVQEFVLNMRLDRRQVILTLVTEAIFKHYQEGFTALAGVEKCIKQLRLCYTCEQVQTLEEYLKAIKATPVTKLTYKPKTMEIQMDYSKSAVEQVTRVFGQDAATLTDDQIIGHISAIEKEIKTLEQIENKPKKLEAKIKAMQGNIKDLVKLVDGRP